MNNDLFEFIKAYVLAETSNNNEYISYDTLVRRATYAYNEAKKCSRES